MDEEGWESLTGSRRATHVSAAAARSSLRDSLVDLPWSILLWPILVPLVVITSMREKGGRVDVHSARRRVRRGGRETAIADIERARLMVIDDGLHFQVESSALSFRIPIHDGAQLTLDSRAREILLDLLPHTSIEMPTSPYDPKGKFARYNFPSYMTKDEAIALMQKPPRPGDPLPIPA